MPDYVQKAMKEAEAFRTTITAEHRLLDLHLREAFQYRDLIFLFVKRDFTAFYKQTILGPLWAIIHNYLRQSGETDDGGYSGGFCDSGLSLLYGRQHLLELFFRHAGGDIQHIPG